MNLTHTAVLTVAFVLRLKPQGVGGKQILFPKLKLGANYFMSPVRCSSAAGGNLPWISPSWGVSFLWAYEQIGTSHSTLRQIGDFQQTFFAFFLLFSRLINCLHTLQNSSDIFQPLHGYHIYEAMRKSNSNIYELNYLKNLTKLLVKLNSGFVQINRKIL